MARAIALHLLVKRNHVRASDTQFVDADPRGHPDVNVSFAFGFGLHAGWPAEKIRTSMPSDRLRETISWKISPYATAMWLLM